MNSNLSISCATTVSRTTLWNWQGLQVSELQILDFHDSTKKMAAKETLFSLVLVATISI
jgi:hypothetical protein